MDHYLASIATFVVEPFGSQETVCKVFTAKPTVEKEVAVGKLFGLAEVGPASTAAAEFLTQLIEQIRGDLYNHTPPRPAGPKASPVPSLEEHFTAMLQQANHGVAKLLESGHLRVDLKTSTMLLGNIRQQLVTFTTVGAITGFLFRYRPHQPYSAVTITEGTAPAEINPLRLFSQTLTGSVGPLDYLFLTTNSLLDYLSLHTIKTAVTNGPTTDAARELKQAVAKANPRLTAAAIIINLVLQRPPAPPAPTLKGFDYASAAAKDSMRALSRTQHRTSRLLSPRLLPDGHKIAAWVQERAARGRAWTRRIAAAVKLKLQVLGGKTALPSAASRGAKTFMPLTGSRARAAAALRGLATAASHQPTVVRLARALTRRTTRVGKWLGQMPPRQRLVWIGSLGLAILLTYNVASLAGRRAQASREKAFATVLAQVEGLRNDAQAALIYQDEAEARSRLNQGLQLLHQLPPSYVNHPTVVRHRRELNTTIVELRHEVVIPEPLRLANFANLDQQARAVPTLVKIGDRLYTQHAKTKALARLEITTRTIAAIQPANLTVGNFLDGESTPKAALLLDSEGRILRLDAAENLRQLPLNLPTTPIQAIGLYRDRLYLLNAAGSAIFRADPTTGGYGTPRSWLQDASADLRLAVDLTLDGDGYVLSSDGTVVRFRQGRKVDFSLQGMDPPLAGPTKIKTRDGSPYLYLLDPPTKRVVVVTKDGKLKQQYRSSRFDELRDIVVDETSKTIYLLNGTQIYGVPMEHLK